MISALAQWPWHPGNERQNYKKTLIPVTRWICITYHYKIRLMSKWMLTAGIVFIALSAMAQEKVIADANAQERKVGSFHGVSASGAIDIYISQGTRNVAISSSDPEDLVNMITEVEDGILHIRFKDKKGWWSDQWNTKGRKFKAYVSAEQISYVSLSGSGNIRIEGRLSSPELKLQLSGSGNISGEIDAENLTVKQSGSSNIKLSGSAAKSEFACSGSGNINSPELKTDICNVRISGSGNAELTVNRELSANISGSGNVRYHGTGNLVNATTSGSGRIRKI
jgi:hypothetical protein